MCVHDAGAALEFHQKAFGATEFIRTPAWEAPPLINMCLDVAQAWPSAQRPGTLVVPLADQFYGERSGRVRSLWTRQVNSTPNEDLSLEERCRRFAESYEESHEASRRLDRWPIPTYTTPNRDMPKI